MATTEAAAKDKATAAPSPPRATDYGKWNRLTNELLEETEALDREEERASSQALGQEGAMYSQAQADEVVKAQAVRRAKEALDAQQEREEAQVQILGPPDFGDDSSPVVRITPERLQEKRVVCLKGIRGPLQVVFGEELADLHFWSTVEDAQNCPRRIQVFGLLKLFVEDCHDLHVVLESPLKVITGTVELSHLKRVRVQAMTRIPTWQLDLCQDVSLELNTHVWGHDTKDRIYHAGVSDSKIQLYHDEKQDVLRAEKRIDYQEDGAVAVANATALEDQFVTYFQTGTLQTEKVVRVGSQTLLQSEFQKSSESWRDEERAKTCREQKLQGKQAFGAGEYGQAVLLYSMAIDTSDGLSRDVFDERHVLFANRSACFLKLGQLEKALEDAQACLELDETYVKGHFRKGVALHALGRHAEAVPVLGKCLQMEPHNPQVAQALQFAQVRLEQETRKRMQT